MVKKDIPNNPQPERAGFPSFRQIGKSGEQEWIRVFRREGGIVKKGNKKDKLSYYIGWGIAYGSCAGGMLSIMLPKHLLVVLIMGIVFGAVIGTVFGKMKT